MGTKRWKRWRGGVRRGAILVVASPLTVSLTAPTAAAQDAPGQADYETTEVADGVYRFRWRSHNTLFVVTPEGVVAFDPISPEAAARYAAEIRRVAPGVPLHALVYSHDHADHISGAPALFEVLGEAPIIAHENASPKIAAANDPNRPPPDSTFSTRAIIELGGQTIELRYLGKSHSDNMLVGFLPEPGLVFAVDFVSHESVGYRDLPDYHYPQLYEAMARLQEIPYETIVFGHGPVGDRASVDGQIRYYETLRSAVRAAIKEGMTREETVARLELPEYAGWRGYDAWFSLNVGTMYDWLK